MTVMTTERRALQIIIAIACIVPITAGLGGVVLGIGFDFATDSHFRYLSGLLLAIGLGFLSGIPNIENQAVRYKILAAIVFTGGLSRLAGVVIIGHADKIILGALAMELIVTPALFLWQRSFARRSMMI